MSHQEAAARVDTKSRVEGRDRDGAVANRCLTPIGAELARLEALFGLNDVRDVSPAELACHGVQLKAA